MRKLTTYQVIFSILLVILVFYFAGWDPALSFGLGAVIAIFNFSLLVWSWQRIFRQKNIALAVGVIVFKYAILGLVAYFIVQSQKVAIVWFIGGLSILLPAILAYALTQQSLPEE